MNNQKQFTLIPFSQEEGEKVIAKLQDFLSENSAEIVPAPLIKPDGTIGVEVKVYKKVELIAKTGVESPIVKNGKFIDGETS